jgi:hypothetical protein
MIKVTLICSMRLIISCLAQSGNKLSFKMKLKSILFVDYTAATIGDDFWNSPKS